MSPDSLVEIVVGRSVKQEARRCRTGGSRILGILCRGARQKAAADAFEAQNP